MAGYDSGPDSDEEPLKLNLFNRKVIGFVGFATEKTNALKKIVQQLGASCDDVPKPYSSKVFTSPEYFDSLRESIGPLYNVTFIRDCVDANKYLNIDDYRFGPDYVQKADYPDFEPCCQNYHNTETPCLVCDPKTEVAVTNVKPKNKPKSTQQPMEIGEVVNNKKAAKNDASKEKDKEKEKDRPTTKPPTTREPWEPWEERLILDYIICNNLLLGCKSPSMYIRMISEGFLAHRSPDAVRAHFRIYILPNIDSYDLPKTILKQFKQVRNANKPLGRNLAFKVPSMLSKQVFKKSIKKKQQQQQQQQRQQQQQQQQVTSDSS